MVKGSEDRGGPGESEAHTQVMLRGTLRERSRKTQRTQRYQRTQSVRGSRLFTWGYARYCILASPSGDTCPACLIHLASQCHEPGNLQQLVEPVVTFHPTFLASLRMVRVHGCWVAPIHFGHSTNRFDLATTYGLATVFFDLVTNRLSASWSINHARYTCTAR